MSSSLNCSNLCPLKISTLLQNGNVFFIVPFISSLSCFREIRKLSVFRLLLCHISNKPSSSFMKMQPSTSLR